MAKTTETHKVFKLKYGEVRSCPFCGNAPTLQHWHGGGPLKRAVHCEYDYCPAGPMVVGATRSLAVDNWNTRSA